MTLPPWSAWFSFPGAECRVDTGSDVRYRHAARIFCSDLVPKLWTPTYERLLPCGLAERHRRRFLAQTCGFRVALWIETNFIFIEALHYF
jgi:hypothetical protein